MKPVKVEHEGIKRAIHSGESYIQVGNRTFLLMEVDHVKEPAAYEVTNPEEEKQLLNALDNDNPILSEQEINETLGR